MACWELPSALALWEGYGARQGQAARGAGSGGSGLCLPPGPVCVHACDRAHTCACGASRDYVWRTSEGTRARMCVCLCPCSCVVCIHVCGGATVRVHVSVCAHVSFHVLPWATLCKAEVAGEAEASSGLGRAAGLAWSCPPLSHGRLRSEDLGCQATVSEAECCPGQGFRHLWPSLCC